MLKKSFLVSVIPSTVSLFPFLSPPASFSFSLQRLRDSGCWLEQKHRHISWPVWVTVEITLLHMDQHTQAVCALFPSDTILWPLITLDMTVISWLYSQSRALSATFRSPLFFFQLCLTAWGMTNSLWLTAGLVQLRFVKLLPEEAALFSWERAQQDEISRDVYCDQQLFPMQDPCEDEINKMSVSEHGSTYMTSGSQMFSIFQ